MVSSGNEAAANATDEDHKPLEDDDLHIGRNVATKTDDDLCSTAESSSMKKQATGIRTSFSVPHDSSSMSTAYAAPYHRIDVSDGQTKMAMFRHLRAADFGEAGDAWCIRPYDCSYGEFSSCRQVLKID